MALNLYKLLLPVFCHHLPSAMAMTCDPIRMLMVTVARTTIGTMIDIAMNARLTERF